MQIATFFQRWTGRGNEGVPRLMGFGEVARPVALILVMLLLIVLSAVLVVYSAYEYRQLFNRHQQLVQIWDEYQVEWGQLLLEQSALGANSLVEQKASRDLDMITPPPQLIEIVNDERQLSAEKN